MKPIIDGCPCALGDEVPPALRNIVDKALENDPAERYQTMRDLVIDLRRAIQLDGENRVAYLFLGEAYEVKGELAKVLGATQRYLTRACNRTEALSRDACMPNLGARPMRNGS